MPVRQVGDPKLAQFAYLIGCPRTGEAIVIDPERDVVRYFDVAARHGLRIVAAAVTHIHADSISGLREMAARGVFVYASKEGGPEWHGAGDRAGKLPPSIRTAVGAQARVRGVPRGHSVFTSYIGEPPRPGPGVCAITTETAPIMSNVVVSTIENCLREVMMDLQICAGSLETETQAAASSMASTNAASG